jgi:hypothetical protein
MAKKITLFSYAKKQDEEKRSADSEILAFLRNVTPGNVLMLSTGEEAATALQMGFSVTVFDDDLSLIQEQKKANPRIEYEYGSRVSFMKRAQSSEYQYIIDNCYCNRLRRRELSRFYKDLAKIMATRGQLFTRAFSTDDPYCKEHSPLRHWTMLKDRYINYFTRSQLTRRIEKAGFRIDSYSVEKAQGIFHVIRARLAFMKLQ